MSIPRKPVPPICMSCNSTECKCSKEFLLLAAIAILAVSGAILFLVS